MDQAGAQHSLSPIEAREIAVMGCSMNRGKPSRLFNFAHIRAFFPANSTAPKTKKRHREPRNGSQGQAVLCCRALRLRPWRLLRSRQCFEPVKLGRQSRQASGNVFQHDGAVGRSVVTMRERFIFLCEQLALCSG
jgi:hypothetical protein